MAEKIEVKPYYGETVLNPIDCGVIVKSKPRAMTAKEKLNLFAKVIVCSALFVGGWYVAPQVMSIGAGAVIGILLADWVMYG